jgi:hypothetical protein
MKILVIHGLRFDSRLTTFQHTLSFARHLHGCDVTYVNGLGLIDNAIDGSEFDLAVITYELVALRNVPFWSDIVNRIAPLLHRSRVKVVMPQDDYSSCALLDQFCVENGIDFVFSPLTRDLEMLYPQSISTGVEFHEAFTGYWESSTAVPYTTLRRPFRERTIDLGQRVRHLPPQLGPAAQRKGELALRFADFARENGFKCDVSTKDADVLVGTDWWRFLGDIRFTVGRLGGASIADPYGRLAARVNQLQLRRPSITYETLARRLRTDELPQGDFTAISPRLFECAAMGVCQILERAHYFDDFEPWRDYIPLDPGLSNLDEVFEAMKDHNRCEEIVRNAEESLIESGRHTYERFVVNLVKTTMGVEISPDEGAPHVIDADEPLFGSMEPSAVEQVKAAARRGVIASFATGKSPDIAAVGHWINSFRKERLIVESMTLPWSPAMRFLAET